MNTREISNRLIQEIESATDSVFIGLEKVGNLYNFLNNIGLDDEDIDLVLKGDYVDVSDVNVTTQENKMKTNNSLELTVPLDILLTPENIDQDKIVNILKESGHYYFNDIEIDEEQRIAYCPTNDCMLLIQYTLDTVAALKVTTFNQLKYGISNSELLKLLDSAGNYLTIQNRIYDNRQDDLHIGIESKIVIFFVGGISESNLVESIKLFTTEYLSMRAMHMEQYLYAHDDED
ncbi:MAG: hypothetical protein NZ824_04680 [Candidatus Thioglobus sp.]|nr:hypothetical protein [Candidatus Thioglobus sp.]